MPVIKTRLQQPQPVVPQIELPRQFPRIPESVLERFPDADTWQRRLDEFWTQTNQALQQAQQQTSAQVNGTVIYSVDRFLVYAGTNPVAMFDLDSNNVRLGGVLVVNTPGRKVYIGQGQYNDPLTPFYVDTLGFFSLGDSLTWDPETDTLTIDGVINATSGTIGGFEIGTDYIRDTINSFGLASAVTGGDDVRFWAGDTFANRASAPVRIFESGTIFLRYLSSTFVGVSGTLSGTSDSYGIIVSGSFRDGAIRLIPTIDTDANGGSAYGVFCLPSIDKNTFTGLTAYGIYSSLPLASGAGTIDNAYGIYIDAINIGATNWGLYVNTTARNYMAGDLTVVSIGATTPGTGAFTTLSATGLATASGSLAVRGVIFPSTGYGWELVVESSSIAAVQSYNRDTAAWMKSRWYASEHEWMLSGVSKMSLSSTGLAVTGDLAVSGLAGVGTRNVVVDAAGVMSAP